MVTVFEEYMKAQGTALSDDQIRLIGAAAVKRVVHRKQILLQAGETCRHKIFIPKGLLRMYRTGADGSEHILKFSTELTWITDGESYTHRTPSAYSIDAIEAGEVLMWSRDCFDTLLNQIPALKAFSDQLISRNLYSSQNRLYKVISATPEEKYDDFINTYPGILLRVPLRMVASYLGVSVKTLTRIRQAQLQRSLK